MQVVLHMVVLMLWEMLHKVELMLWMGLHEEQRRM